MFVGITDIFKIGIGPSSSHTMGPMSAGSSLLGEPCLSLQRHSSQPTHLQARIHGSLAFTGKGHATDRAIYLGLMGFVPATLDPAQVDAYEARLQADKQIDHP